MAWVRRDQVATLLFSLIGQLSYSVSLQRAFLFLLQIPISSLPGALAWHKGTEMRVRLQPAVRAGRGRQVSRQRQPAGLKVLGTCTRHLCHEPLPGTCAGYPALSPALPCFRRDTVRGSSLVQAGCGYTSKQTRPANTCCPKRPAVHAGSISQPTWIDFFSPKEQGGQIQAGLGEQSPACVTHAWALGQLPKLKLSESRSAI